MPARAPEDELQPLDWLVQSTAKLKLAPLEIEGRDASTASSAADAASFLYNDQDSRSRRSSRLTHRKASLAARDSMRNVIRNELLPEHHDSPPSSGPSTPEQRRRAPTLTLTVRKTASGELSYISDSGLPAGLAAKQRRSKKKNSRSSASHSASAALGSAHRGKPGSGKAPRHPSRSSSQSSLTMRDSPSPTVYAASTADAGGLPYYYHNRHHSLDDSGVSSPESASDLAVVSPSLPWAAADMADPAPVSRVASPELSLSALDSDPQLLDVLLRPQAALSEHQAKLAYASELDERRPRQPLLALAALALLASREHRMALRQIVAWIRRHHAFYHRGDQRWQTELAQHLQASCWFFQPADGAFLGDTPTWALTLPSPTLCAHLRQHLAAPVAVAATPSYVPYPIGSSCLQSPSLAPMSMMSAAELATKDALEDFLQNALGSIPLLSARTPAADQPRAPAPGLDPSAAILEELGDLSFLISDDSCFPRPFDAPPPLAAAGLAWP